MAKDSELIYPTTRQLYAVRTPSAPIPLRAFSHDICENIKTFVVQSGFDGELSLECLKSSPQNSFGAQMDYFKSLKGGLPRDVVLSPTVTLPIGSTIRDLGLGFGDPEGIFLSLDCAVTILAGGLDSRVAKLSELESGARSYATEEQKAEAISKIEREVLLIKTVVPAIKDSSAYDIDFAPDGHRQKGRYIWDFPFDDRIYAEILRKLLLIRDAQHWAPRNKIIHLVKDGNILEAYTQYLSLHSQLGK